MASLGKKILSAFVELDDKQHPEQPEIPATTGSPAPVPPAVTRTQVPVPPQGDAAHKFSEHFNRLFTEARLPGPGYHEFSKMIAAMQVIADEKARFCAAFAGLQVQGLDKPKLLGSAQEYLQLLAADAAAFHQTIDAALTEKVKAKKAEIATGSTRIQQLSQEIMLLQQQMQSLEQEVAENEAKLESNAAGYDAALLAKKDALMEDMEKIKQHIL